MFICRNAEGLHTYLLKCYRGTFSSVGMLKGYMVKERLGAPDLALPCKIYLAFFKELMEH